VDDEARVVELVDQLRRFARWLQVGQETSQPAVGSPSTRCAATQRLEESRIVPQP